MKSRGVEGGCNDDETVKRQASDGLHFMTTLLEFLTNREIQHYNSFNLPCDMVPPPPPYRALCLRTVPIVLSQCKFCTDTPMEHGGDGEGGVGGGGG